MALAAGNHEINKSFEAGPLARLVRGPAVVVERLTVLSGVAIAEQIFEPVLADERVTLDVEEHVAGRGWREGAKADVRFYGQQLEARLSRVAGFDLQPCLLAHPLEGGRGSSARLPSDRDWQLRERTRSRHFIFDELGGLDLREAGDQAQMVVGAALLGAGPI